MEFNTEISAILAQIPSPAFVVKDGKIAQLNEGAQSRGLTLGANFLDLLETGKDEYETLIVGQMSAIVHCVGFDYDTTVIRQGQDTLCILQSEYQQPELKALSLAAQHLRDPLSSAMNDADLLLSELSEQIDPKLHRQLMQINRSLYRLQRVVGNMSDAARYQRAAVSLELRDAVQILAEILEKAAQYLAQSGMILEYTLPNASVYTLVNTELLERSVLNLISNAAKKCDDTVVRVAVTKTDKNICITVQNKYDGKHAGSLFDRYLRQPELEDGKNGIGLGLTIVRSCAYTHGGTVLTDRSDCNLFKITMSLKIRNSSDNVFRTPVQLPFDYAGGRDHTLIELSDILSSDIYNQ